jgi:hypothetical protein
MSVVAARSLVSWPRTDSAFFARKFCPVMVLVSSINCLLGIGYVQESGLCQVYGAAYFMHFTQVVESVVHMLALSATNNFNVMVAVVIVDLTSHLFVVVQ